MRATNGYPVYGLVTTFVGSAAASLAAAASLGAFFIFFGATTRRGFQKLFKGFEPSHL
jgi:hypothetical protein